MRLLNAKTLGFQEFFDNNIPKYAILSHTWGEGEVSFQDIQRLDTASEKTGFPKIQKCCELAVEDGYDWAWVDTCCIDKTSSAELTEAINSMFEWYKRSNICYAYLADVPTIENPKESEDFKSAFAASRWFTRGWTLQELLAPRNVRFLSKEWVKIGTKRDLYEEISRITAIEISVLRSDSRAVISASVAKKMSWASKRNTTRIEDRAYCLLGIFEVNMPLIYGEGHKAFKRLQMEIMAISSDYSLFAWTYFANKYYTFQGLLADSPAQFRGSGDFVPYPDWKGGASFSAKKSGLEIELDICSAKHFPDMHLDPQVQFLAALGCHVEHNFWDILALPVTQFPGEKFARARALAPNTYEGPDIHHIPRDLWMRGNSTLQRVFVSNEPPGMAQGYSPDPYLRLFPLSRRNYMISEAYPPDCWDKARTKIIESKQLDCKGSPLPTSGLSKDCWNVGFLLVEGTKRFILRLRTGMTFYWSVSTVDQNSSLKDSFDDIPLHTEIVTLKEGSTKSCVVDGEIFELSFVKERRTNYFEHFLEIDIWSKEQSKSEEILKIRKSRNRIRNRGDCFP